MEAPPMARTRYATDKGLIARMGVTMFMIGLVFTAFIILVIFLLGHYGVSQGGIVFIAVLLGGGMTFGSYYWSDKIALRTAGARLVSPQEAPELHGVVPAVRACRHAQAAGGDRADGHAECLRHRSEQQGRRALRHSGAAPQARPQRARGRDRP